VTLIIVSHRLSLVRETDEIFVLEEGEITARGPHQELMRSSDLYKQMVTRNQSADAA
jgi:ATP-binding cassette subfamily B protein